MTAISREMLRLIREIKPEFVIGENVQGIINLQNGMVLRQVQDQLESEGFEVQCFLIPASGIGAWHQRYRVWIVAHSQHNGLLAAEKRRDEKDYGGSQKGQNETIEPTRTSGSRNDEDLSRHGSVEKHLRSKKQSFPTPTTFDSNEINKPRKPHPGGGQKPPLNQVVKMYPTPTQDSASERTKKYKQGGETIDSSSSRGGEENVSNTESIG